MLFFIGKYDKKFRGIALATFDIAKGIGHPWTSQNDFDSCEAILVLQ